MGAKIKGADKLSLLLRQGGERAVRRARSQMKREIGKIEQLAKDFAPVDHKGPGPGLPPGHELERSIRQRRTYENNRRLAVAVDVGGTVDGVDVDDYALLMHEGLAPYGSGAFQPGPATKAKGGQAGGKFLERAYKEREQVMVKEIITHIKKEFE